MSETAENTARSQKLELTELVVAIPFVDTSVTVEVNEETGLSVGINLAKQEWVRKYLGFLAGKSAGFGKLGTVAMAAIFKMVQGLANRMKLPCHVHIVSNLSGSAIPSIDIPGVKNAIVTSSEGKQEIVFDVEPEEEISLIGLS